MCVVDPDWRGGPLALVVELDGAQNCVEDAYVTIALDVLTSKAAGARTASTLNAVDVHAAELDWLIVELIRLRDVRRGQIAQAAS